MENKNNLKGMLGLASKAELSFSEPTLSQTLFAAVSAVQYLLLMMHPGGHLNEY